MASLTGLKRIVRALHEPAPMHDFDDFDDYWERRGETKIFPRWRIAVRFIPDGASVLDVGSGSGNFLRYVRQHRPACEIEAADFAAVPVTIAESAGFVAHRLDLSREQLPGTYDYVTCFEVLEHIPDAEKAIRSLVAGCKKQVIISIPNVGYIVSRIRLGIFGRFPVTNCVYHIKEHVRHWTPRDFDEWTKRLDLRVVHQEGQYGIPWLWKRWPALFARGMVYVIEPVERGHVAPEPTR